MTWLGLCISLNMYRRPWSNSLLLYAALRALYSIESITLSRNHQGFIYLFTMIVHTGSHTITSFLYK